MMIVRAGLMPASRARDYVRIISLSDTDQEALRTRVLMRLCVSRRTRSLLKAYHESWGVDILESHRGFFSVIIPSLDDAKNEVEVDVYSSAILDEEMFAFRRFLERCDLFLVGGAGEKISVSHEILNGSFGPSATGGMGFNWAFLEHISMSVSVKRGKAMISAIKDMELYGLATRYQSSMMRKLESQNRYFDDLLQFENYYLVIDENDVRDRDRIRRAFRLDANGDVDPACSVYTDLLRDVSSALPEGKQDLTWQQVETITGYSRRSINRALAAVGGHEWWAKGGQRPFF